MSTTISNVPGQAGGLSLVRRKGTNYMSRIGRRGGNAVVEKYGTEYMSLIGELGNPNISQRRRKAIVRTISSFVDNTNS